MNTKILIVDNKYITRLGTVGVLNCHFEDIVIDSAENYTEAKVMLKSTTYDLIILDVDTKIHKIKEFSEIQNNNIVLIFSSCDESSAIEYIREGAKGYLNKLASEKDIIKAVKTVLEDKCYYSKSIAQKLADHSSQKNIKDVLSEKEFQVFKLLLHGYRNMEMSEILKLHVATVNTYRSRIFKKLKVNNIVDLMKYLDY